MKKTALIIAAALFITIGGACKKDNTSTISSVDETVNVSINANESYRYTLPATEDNSSFNLETPSAKSANTSVETDASGSTFVYTPASNTSTRTEVIVVSNNVVSMPPQGGHCGNHHQGNSNGQCGNGGGSHTKKGGHPHGKKDCGNDNKSKHRITFNITVNGISN
jgi:hypothetical protein